MTGLRLRRLGRVDYAACLAAMQDFTDRRDQDRIEHSVQTLVGQRVLALALGYEDLNDHHALRHDPLLAAAQPSVPSVTTMGWAKPRADRRVAQASARFPDWQRM